MNTFLFTALALGAPALKGPAKNEVNVVGEWKLVKFLGEGQEILVPLESIEFTAKGKMGYRSPRSETFWQRYRVYGTREHGRIDKFNNEFNGVENPEEGLFELDGDTLTICFRVNNRSRPDSISQGPQSENYIMVFKRQTKK